MANIRAAQIIDPRFYAPTLGNLLGSFAKGAVIFGYIADAAKP
jgi:hypothetical protein